MLAIPFSMEITTMDIEFDRRHVFYFDTDGNIRLISPYRLDRLWRGEPDATMPELAGQRVRFAILHIERFSRPPLVIIEHYPVLTFDATGNLDLELQYAQLQADVDHLEATNYAPMLAPVESESTWHPDPTTRRRLIAATKPIYTTRMTTSSRPFQAEEPRSQATYGRAHRANLRWQSPGRLEGTRHPSPSLPPMRHPQGVATFSDDARSRCTRSLPPSCAAAFRRTSPPAVPMHWRSRS
jgi:hypothetical protein